MIYFHHIPKTAGVSFYESIKNIDGIGYIDHFTNIKYFKLNENDKIFTIVRNPFDRFLSAYNYLIKGGNNSEYDRYAYDILKSIPSFDDFIFNPLLSSFIRDPNVRHFNPMCQITKKIKYDLIVKYEIGIDKIIETFKNEFKLNTETQIYHINKSEKIISYLTDEHKKIIYKEYKEDFLEYNY
jgi:hypothetical protein